jgi:hypothetical protein
MDMKAGATIWIPCEVKPGPFSNERLVRVTAAGAEWVGFVDERHLKDAHQAGATLVRAKVTSVDAERFEARLPGHSLGAGRLFHGSCSNVTRIESSCAQSAARDERPTGDLGGNRARKKRLRFR